MKSKRRLLMCLLLSMALFTGCAAKDKPQETSNSSAQESDAPAKALTEDEAQRNEGILGALPDIEYTYEGIVKHPKGIVYPPRLSYYDRDAVKNGKAYDALLEKAFEPIQPVADNASQEEIDRLFKQILYVVGNKYEPVESINRWSYLVFKNDDVNPVTGKSLKEDVQVNLEIVLDASGSMNAMVGDETMMAAAKKSINHVIAALPANTKVGLRVFGHKGDNTDSGQAESCAANELLVPIKTLDADAIKMALDGVEAKGWTSIAQSIENGARDLNPYKDKKDLNIIYIITDGIETCGGNPKEAAAALKNGDTKVVLGIIGFNVDAQQDALLKDIAEAGGGKYSTADEAASLTRELSNIHELALSPYDWVPLDDAIITKVRSGHIGGLLGNKILASTLPVEENNNINTANRILSQQKRIGFDKDVYKTISKMAKTRSENIQKIYDEVYAERQRESDQYLQTLSKRKGEMVAFVPSTSTMDPNSKNYIPFGKRNE